MTSILDPFREEVRAFLAAHSMSPEHFGREAAGDPTFCERLFDTSKTFQTRTLDKVAAWMRTNGSEAEGNPVSMMGQDATLGEYDYDRRIEIYKVMVESAERGIDRRHALNRFYFSVIVAIFVSISFVVQSGNENFPAQTVVSSALFLAFLNSVLWLSIIFAARRLNASKYDAICELEQEFEYAPFSREWEIHVSKGRNFPRFTLIEIMLPSLLAGICLLLFVLIASGTVNVG